jgi:hypothetical protein
MDPVDFVADHPFGTVFVVAMVMLAAAPIRNSVMKAVNGLLSLTAALPMLGAMASTRFLPTMDHWVGGWLKALSVEPEDATKDRQAAWSGWDVLMPGFWAGIFGILAASDLFLVDLRLAAMLGIEPYLANTDLPVDLFLAVMFTAVAATFGFAIPELRNASLTRRPWATLGHDDRSRLLRLCVVCLILTILAAAILWVWAESSGGRGSSLGEFGPAAPTLFWIALVAPLLTATIISGFAALPVLGVFVLLVLVIVRVLLLTVRFIAITFVWIVDKLAEVIVLIYDIPARPGAGSINFFGRRMPEEWRPPKIEFEPRPRIGAELWALLEDTASTRNLAGGAVGSETDREADPARQPGIAPPFATSAGSLDSSRPGGDDDTRTSPVTAGDVDTPVEQARQPVSKTDAARRRRVRLVRRMRRFGA